MMPCIMIGDSIAVGVGQARPECETVAQVGISSERYIATMLPPGRTKAETAVISLGVNDDASLDTLENLRLVRTRIAAQRVVWLLPGLKENVRSMIRTVAAENGDRTLDTRPQVGRDHLHPNGAGYEVIANQAVGAATGVEVAYAPADIQTERAEIRRPLRRAATPAERIRRLRDIRQAEFSHPAPRLSPRPGARASHPAAAHATHAAAIRRGSAHTIAAVRSGPPLASPALRAPLRTKVAAACLASARSCRDKGRSVRS